MAWGFGIPRARRWWWWSAAEKAAEKAADRANSPAVVYRAYSAAVVYHGCVVVVDVDVVGVRVRVLRRAWCRRAGRSASGGVARGGGSCGGRGGTVGLCFFRRRKLELLLWCGVDVDVGRWLSRSFQQSPR